MSGFKLIPFKSRGAGFERLIAPHLESLYRQAYRFTGSRHDAEDLVQELLTRLYPKLKELQQVEELRPWLARSLHNLFIDTIRSRQRSALGKSESDSEAILEVVVDNNPSPADALDQQDQASQIALALESLSEAHRDLIIMHDVEGYTLPELTIIFEQPLGTLKSRLHRARKKLREQIKMEPFEKARRVSG